MPYVPAFLAMVLPSVALAVPTSGDFTFLDPFLKESTRTLAERETRVARRAETEASLATAQARFLPTATLGADTDVSKSFQYNEQGRRLNPDADPTQTWSARAALGQNLFAGGADRLRVAAARTRLDIADLDVAQWSQGIRSSLLADVTALANAQRLLSIKEAAINQAKELERIAARKRQGGFLGLKSLTETQRETVRATRDFQSALETLEKNLRDVNTKYALSESLLTRQILQSFEPMLASLSNNGAALLARPGAEHEARRNDPSGGFRGIAADIGERSSPLKINALEEKANDQQTRLQGILTYAPALDLSLGVQGARSDLRNLSGPVRDAAARTSAAPYAQLGFSVSIFNPVGSAQTEEIAARKRSLIAQRNQIFADIERLLSEARTERALQESNLAGLKEIVRLSQEIVSQNTRLFNAGEIDTTDVINAQRELFAQQEAFLDIENRLRSLFVELAHTYAFGYLPRSEGVR